MPQDNPDLLGVTLVFEPDALDGRDADFVGHPYSDLVGGRFATYAYRDEQKQVAIEKLDMADAMVEVWYGTPVKAKRTVITPAYIDQIEGRADADHHHRLAHRSSMARWSAHRASISRCPIFRR